MMKRTFTKFDDIVEGMEKELLEKRPEWRIKVDR
jgi:hypothetical protein